MYWLFVCHISAAPLRFLPPSFILSLEMTSSSAEVALAWSGAARDSVSGLNKDVSDMALHAIQQYLLDSSNTTASAITTLDQNHEKVVGALNARIALLERSITAALNTHISQVEACLTTSIQEREEASSEIAKMARDLVFSAISDLTPEGSSLSLQQYVSMTCSRALDQVRDLTAAQAKSSRTITQLEEELAFVKRTTVPVEHLTEATVQLTTLESHLASKALELESIKQELADGVPIPPIPLPSLVAESCTGGEAAEDPVHRGILAEAIQSVQVMCDNAQRTAELAARNANLSTRVNTLEAESARLQKQAANATELLEASKNDYEVKERQVAVLTTQLSEALYHLELHNYSSSSRSSVSPPPAATVADRKSLYRPLRKTVTLGVKLSREGTSPDAPAQVDMSSIEKVIAANVKLVEELQANKLVMERMLSAASSVKRHRSEVPADGEAASLRKQLWGVIATPSLRFLETEEETADAALQDVRVGTTPERNGDGACTTAEEELAAANGATVTTSVLDAIAVERTFASLSAKVDEMVSLSLRATQVWTETLGGTPSSTATSVNGIVLEGMRTALGKYANLCSQQESAIVSYSNEVNTLRSHIRDLEATVALAPTTEILSSALQDAAQAMLLAVDTVGSSSASAKPISAESAVETSLALELDSHLSTIASRENTLMHLLDLTAKQSLEARQKLRNGSTGNESAVIATLKDALEEERARADRYVALYEQYAEEGISWMDQLWTMESRAAAAIRELDDTKANYVPMSQHTETLVEMNTLIQTEKTLRDTILTLEGQLKTKSDDYTSTYNKYYQLQSQMSQNDAEHRNFQRGLEEQYRGQQSMVVQLSEQLAATQQEKYNLSEQCSYAQDQIESLTQELEHQLARLDKFQKHAVLELAKAGLISEVFPDVSSTFLQNIQEGLFDVLAYRNTISSLESQHASTSSSLKQMEQLYSSESCARQQATANFLAAQQQLDSIESDNRDKMDALIIELTAARRSIALLTRERDEAIAREESRKLQVALLSTDPVSENVRKYGLKVSKDLQSQLEETMGMLASMQRAKEEVEEQLHSANVELVSAKQHISELESNKLSLEQTIAESELKIVGLESDLATSAETIHNLTRTTEEIEVTKKALLVSEEKLRQAQAVSANVEKSFKQLQDQSKRLTAALTARKPESESVHQQLQQQKDEIETLRKRLQMSTNRFTQRQLKQ